MTAMGALALAVTGLWLVLAGLAVTALPRRWHHRAARALVLAGVPVLGWLTLAWGPGPGVAGLAVGVPLLLLLGRHRAGRAQARMTRADTRQ